MNLSQAVAQLLLIHGVDTAFGLPGIHNLALYEAFRRAGFNLLDVRHEQSASFMADGYARATGKPAVCLVIEGPGYLNSATGIAQAKADSVPMIVVTPVAPPKHALGRLHELPEQPLVAQAVARHVCTVSLDPQAAGWCQLRQLLDRVGRPGPIHIQIPLADMDKPFAAADLATPFPVMPTAKGDEVRAAIQLLARGPRSVVIAGGGSMDAVEAMQQLVERLDAPCVNTVNAKGILPKDHPLHVGGSPSLPEVRALLESADVVLAVGTELGETDFDFFASGRPLRLRNLIRVDIDRPQLRTNAEPQVALHGDATETLIRLLEGLPPQQYDGAERAQSTRRAVSKNPYYDADYAAFLAVLEENVEMLVGDSTQPTYYATWLYEPNQTRSYFHSVSGFGTLGYALPAAIGAQLGAPHKRVACLIGDGGAQFTCAELATAKQRDLAIAFIVWNNGGYAEIDKAAAARTAQRPYANPQPPNFMHLAAAFDLAYANPDSLESLKRALNRVYEQHQPALIEVLEEDFVREPKRNWYS